MLFGLYEICFIEFKCSLRYNFTKYYKIYIEVLRKNIDEFHCEYKTMFCLHLYKPYI